MRHYNPVCLCTDDSGVFATSLLREYALAAVHLGLTGDDVRELALGALEFGFAGEAVLRGVRRRAGERAERWRGIPRWACGGATGALARELLAGRSAARGRELRELLAAATAGAAWAVALAGAAAVLVAAMPALRQIARGGAVQA